MGIGTLANTGAIILGGLLGLLLKNALRKGSKYSYKGYRPMCIIHRDGGAMEGCYPMRAEN